MGTQMVTGNEMKTPMPKWSKGSHPKGQTPSERFVIWMCGSRRHLVELTQLSTVCVKNVVVVGRERLANLFKVRAYVAQRVHRYSRTGKTSERRATRATVIRHIQFFYHLSSVFRIKAVQA